MGVHDTNIMVQIVIKIGASWYSLRSVFRVWNLIEIGT